MFDHTRRWVDGKIPLNRRNFPKENPAQKKHCTKFSFVQGT
jgi:hypothetical protein